MALFDSDREGLLDACVHCGLCLEACPTFVLTGREADSPRGRIHLMRSLHESTLAVTREAVDPIDRCLGCRACETACPSGVQYGELLETARSELGSLRPRSRLERFLVSQVLWRGRALSRITRMVPGWVWEVPKRLASIVPGSAALRGNLLPRPEESGFAANQKIGEGPRITVMRGCVAGAFFAQNEAATAKLLCSAGYSVEIVDHPECCGAMAAHAGCGSLARRLSTQLEESLAGRPGVTVMTASGCAAHAKNIERGISGTAGHSNRVADMASLVLGGRAPLSFRPAEGETVAWHPACHAVHGAGSDEPSRKLMAETGVTVVEAAGPAFCCGSAGSYNLALPQLGGELGGQRADVLAATGAQLVVTENPGCAVQLKAHARGRFKVVLLSTYLCSRLSAEGQTEEPDP